MCLTIALAEGWLVWAQWKLARSASMRSERLGTELRALSGTTPPLNAATTVELTAELSGASKILSDLRAQLAPGGAVGRFEGPDTQLERADGFFVIASFVETMREKAEGCGVRLKSDERFGFADYIHAGPQLRDLPRVLRERHATELLLKAVFAARPHQLISVQRERPSVGGDARRESASSSGGYARADYFDWDPRDPNRQAGSIDNLALRVSFVGQTVALRSLLNRLAEFEMPLIVRAVEVAPVARGGERPDEASDLEVPRPLISQSLSRFTITVELMEWIDAPGTQS